MPRNQYNRSIFTVLFTLALTGAGCAHRHAPDANAKQPAKTPLATTESASAESSNDAKLLFKSGGMPMPVMYSISSSPQACQGFERVGRVFDSGRGTLLPWIANLTEKANKGINRTEVSRTRNVPANVPIQVKGYSRWSSSSANALQTTTWDQACGPLVTTFTPEPSKTYLVEFVFSGASSCRQQVSDITNPQQPVPVTDQAASSCAPD
jgi:hypothetical protein